MPSSLDTLYGFMPLEHDELLPSQTFTSMYDVMVRRGNAHQLPPQYQIHLAIDPGETTGIAVGYSEHSYLQKVICLQYQTDQLAKAYPAISTLLGIGPSKVVIEDYKVYQWKADSHAWASLHTPMLIGYITALWHAKVFNDQMAVQMRNADTDAVKKPHDNTLLYEPMKATQEASIQPIYRMAQPVKKFCTDDMLKKWTLYSSGLRHGRDAVRHLVFELFFSKSMSGSA